MAQVSEDPQCDYGLESCSLRFLLALRSEVSVSQVCKKARLRPYVKTAQSNQEKWRMCPHKNLLLNVHSIIHSNQKVETIQMPINWWTDKQNLVCPYKEILFDNKRNEVMIQAVTWMTFKTLYQVKKIPHYMIAFIWNVQKRQIHGVKRAN